MLAHPVAHPCPVNKRSKYTVMKTHLFQASAAYLPDDFIKVGQLTKRVDIFSCGIVSFILCGDLGLNSSVLSFASTGYHRGWWTCSVQVGAGKLWSTGQNWPMAYFVWPITKSSFYICKRLNNLKKKQRICDRDLVCCPQSLKYLLCSLLKKKTCQPLK